MDHIAPPFYRKTVLSFTKCYWSRFNLSLLGLLKRDIILCISIVLWLIVAALLWLVVLRGLDTPVAVQIFHFSRKIFVIPVSALRGNWIVKNVILVTENIVVHVKRCSGVYSLIFEMKKNFIFCFDDQYLEEKFNLQFFRSLKNSTAQKLTIALLRSENESLHESSELLPIVGHFSSYLNNNSVANCQKGVQLSNFRVAILPKDVKSDRLFIWDKLLDVYILRLLSNLKMQTFESCP